MTKSESAFLRQLKHRGFVAFRKGWPDFLAFDQSGKPHLIELKTASSRPTKHHVAMHKAMEKAFSCPVEVWRTIHDFDFEISQPKFWREK